MLLEELFAHCFESPSVLAATGKLGRRLRVRVAPIEDASTSVFRLDTAEGRRIVHGSDASRAPCDGLFFSVARPDPAKPPSVAFLLVKLQQGGAFDRAVEALRATYEMLAPGMAAALANDPSRRARWGAAVRSPFSAPVDAKAAQRAFHALGVRFVVLDRDDATADMKRLLGAP